MTVQFSRPVESNIGYSIWMIPQSVLASISTGGFLVTADSVIVIEITGTLWFELTYATPRCSVLKGILNTAPQQPIKCTLTHDSANSKAIIEIKNFNSFSASENLEILMKVENQNAATGSYSVAFKVWPDSRAITLLQHQFSAIYTASWSGLVLSDNPFSNILDPALFTYPPSPPSLKRLTLNLQIPRVGASAYYPTVNDVFTLVIKFHTYLAPQAGTSIDCKLTPPTLP
jgi:hypothetical protein